MKLLKGRLARRWKGGRRFWSSRDWGGGGGGRVLGFLGWAFGDVGYCYVLW